MANVRCMFKLQHRTKYNGRFVARHRFFCKRFLQKMRLQNMLFWGENGIEARNFFFMKFPVDRRTIIELMELMKLLFSD